MTCVGMPPRRFATSRLRKDRAKLAPNKRQAQPIATTGHERLEIRRGRQKQADKRSFEAGQAPGLRGPTNGKQSTGASPGGPEGTTKEGILC